MARITIRARSPLAGAAGREAGASPPAALPPRCQSLQALTAMALALPGLVLAPAPVGAVEIPSSTAQNVSHLAIQDYVPTGASRQSGALAASPDSSKRYRIECYDDGSGKPAKVRVRIQGKTRSAKYNVKATLEANGDIGEVIDTSNGNGLYSKYAEVQQGDVVYTLTVSKVKKKPKHKDAKLRGRSVFETRQECDTESGAYTGLRKPVEIP